MANETARMPIATRAENALATVVLALFFLTFPALGPAHSAVDIQEVRSKGGITAWLVEDYTVPIVALRFIFEGGSTQDPEGKEGLANLMTGLFDEGAGDLDADTFQLELDDAGAEMGFDAGRDAISGGMRTLAETRGEAFSLLKLALTQPRFDQAPIDRIRAQIVAGIQSRARDPETAARIAFAEAVYGDHPYARRSEGTPETLATITGDDLRTLHSRLFARENLIVGVVGAIDAETLAAELDRIFGELPASPDLVRVADVEPKLGKMVSVEYPLPQTSLQLAYRGIEREDPEFFPALLMNHILGGGAFSSRLFDEVREKRGLAYGIGSSLSNSRHADLLVIGTATDPERADEALGVIRETVAKMAEDGPTEAELDAAKRYLLGSYAINNLDSSGAIANTLVGLQFEKLGLDYIERRPALIRGVTREQAAAQARRLLSEEPAVLMIGPRKTGDN
ncbi:pitrilysin family protein [Mesorhizobium sp. Z1-4]|uniref:M16 family metallopeptidase n=1 Tax=Mesorhizobium sp. Z1-4 TaxID=2448478 RepID=UPI001FDEADB6|nr:pitrilysin family protein [Mesorhizobium sp. Z1-4]